MVSFHRCVAAQHGIVARQGSWPLSAIAAPLIAC
jgi:hypothetical protein